MNELEAGLRDRLVEAGVELVTNGGSAAVSLREIARRAGVSHGAPRRYFPTHLELLSAVARRGFADLAARLREAVGGSTDDPRARVSAMARAYLEFATSSRGMYELMFRHDLLQSGGRLGLREASLPLFRWVAALVSEAVPESGTPPEVVTGALWASLHGIAQLWDWETLPFVTGLQDPEPLLRAVLDAHLGPRKSTEGPRKSTEP